MKKFLSLILFSFFCFNSSYADQGYYGVQINCYEEAGYYEIRNHTTANMNKYGAWEEENLINLYIPGDGDDESYGSIIKKCTFSPQRGIENKITIKVILYPYCYAFSENEKIKNKCTDFDIKFDIWHIDNNGEKLIFDKTSFFIFEHDDPRNDQLVYIPRIDRIEYLPKDLYFSVHLKYRIKMDTKDLGDRYYSDDTYNLKEMLLWLPGSISSIKHEYPVTNKTFQKMYN